MIRDADFVPWWDKSHEKDEERASSLLAHASDVESRHQEQHENNLLYAQMYSNRELLSFDWGYGVTTDASLSPVSRLSENLALSIVDTFVSHVGKARPKAAVVLRGAPWSLRRSARRLDRWLYASFLELDTYKQGKLAFRDAAIFGFGVLRVDVDGSGRLGITRVFPDDVLVDNRECLSGQPPVHLFIRRVMTHAEAKSRWDIPDEILEKASKKRYLGYRGVGPDHVVVVEGFRRGIRNESGRVIPGHRVLAVQNHIIDEEVWNEEWFPVVFFHWQPPVNGWYSPGCVEQVFPYQLRLNEINEKIRSAQDLMSVVRILVPEGSRVNVHQITNEVGKFIRYTGPMKPEALAWPGASGEIYGERDRLVRSCYEFMGISQMSAQARAPENARFDSSVAFREFSQIEQARFTDLAQRFEEFYLGIANTIVRVMHRYNKDQEMVWWRGGGRARAETIRWADIDLARDKYILTLEASSILNQTPAGRREALEEMRARGEITPEEYAQHQANPDLEQLASLASAAADDIDRVIELLEDEKFEAPTEYQDLVNGVQRVHSAYLRLREWEDVPETIFENFEAWMLHARAILVPEPEENPAPAAATAGAVPPSAGDPTTMMGAGPMGPVPNAPMIPSVGPPAIPLSA